MLEKIFFPWMDKPRFPIIQGGMGAGISLMNLAAAVSNADAMGTLSSAALDQFTSARVGERLSMVDAVAREVSDTKRASFFVAINVMVKLVGSYEDSIEGAVKGGANMIISGAGLPANLPKLVERFASTRSHNIALVPIVSSAEALHILISRYWEKANHLPDAVVLEGPKAGGHLGFSYKAINRSGEHFLRDYDLFTVLLDPVLKITESYHIPLFVAGGIRSKEDILYALSRGAAGVQIGTPFAVAYESGASAEFKQAIINSRNEDVLLGDESWGSPAGYPYRYLRNSPLVEQKTGSHFCICSALVSATDTALPPKEGRCPERYVRPLKGACPAHGNVSYCGLYTSGTEIDMITEETSTAKVIRNLTE